jgi:hypothetical protein
MTSRMKDSLLEFTVGWRGDKRILVETEFCRGLEFEVSPDGKGVLNECWTLGLEPENIDDHYVEAARREAEEFLCRQHGERLRK